MQEKNDELLNRVPVGIGIFEIRDGVTKRLYMNDWFYQMTENPVELKEDYKGDAFFQILYQEDVDRVLRSIQEVRDGADYSVTTCRVYTAEHRLKWLRVFSSVARRDEDSILVYTSYVDMSYEMEARAVLTQNNELLHRALEIASMAVWEYDPIHKVLTQTSNCTELTGYKNRVIQNAPESMIAAGYVKEEYVSAYRDFFNQFSTEKKTVEAVFEVKNWESNRYWYEHVTMTPVFDESGKLIKGIGTSINVTERQKAEAEKERLRNIENDLELAQKASAAKTEFLSRMSHDIRTPMNAIMGMTHLAEQTSDLAEIREYLNHISTSSQFLLGLINDILDMSKIENGDLTLHPEPYNREEFEKSVNTIIRPLMEQKKIKFVVDIGQGDRCLMLDKLRFNQIFLNLLSNAAKFTPEGGTVEFTSQNLPPRKAFVGIRFRVKDTGIGMSREFLPHLFEAFAQEKTVENEHEIGTGLGLPIVKSLVDAMGGTIRVTSELGKGTEYTIDLYVRPARVMLSEEQAIDSQYHLTGAQILLVEDNDLNILVARKLLEKVGCQVTTAHNGVEAVRAFETSPQHFFWAILMDVRMPIMNGLEATGEIRRMKRADAMTVPIIAMTADAFAEERQKTIEAGMNDHLTKPIQPTLLYDVLEHVSQII